MLLCEVSDLVDALLAVEVVDEALHNEIELVNVFILEAFDELVVGEQRLVVFQIVHGNVSAVEHA